MQFTEGSFYHIYNRGNDKQRIFYTHSNYIFFLEKIRRYIKPNCNILAWTLMPNHFHLLIQANAETCRLVKHTPIPINTVTEGIRMLLSSYTKAIQKQEGKVGNLFQQKTKSKCVDDYAFIAFHYIHQNALKARLSKSMEGWQYSSFGEYQDKDSANLCNPELACKFLGINLETFVQDSYGVLSEHDVKKIF